eukprot:Pgem_evm1s18112
MGKVLLLQANLDDSFWAEAFDTASTILTICNGSYAKKHNMIADVLTKVTDGTTFKRHLEHL